MLSNFFYFFIVIILLSFTPDTSAVAWIESPLKAFLLGMTLYLFLIMIIFLQRNRRMLNLVNIELICFLIVYHFVLGTYRFFGKFQSLYILFSLLLYLGGLAFFHFVTHRKNSHTQPLQNALNQILLILPFGIPLIVFSIAADFVPFSSEWINDYPVLITLAAILFAFALICIMPPLVIYTWQCRPLNDPNLLPILEDTCKKLHFTHAGFKTWTVMNHSYTAGIVGIVPWFRYIMFTQNLLNRLPKEETQAVLIHEIGHNKYKHLWLYPFILFGMILLSGFLATLLINFIPEDLQLSEVETILLPIGVFLFYVIFFGLYLRIVFGFFSRLFERQADLYIFESDLSPQYMANALNTIAVATGNSHRHPSWHHHSIQERIDFLERAIQNPNVVKNHHKKVKIALAIYFLLFFVGLFFFIKGM